MGSTRILSKTRIAKIFDMTTRNVEYLVENAIIEPESTEPMKFGDEAITAYIKYLKTGTKDKSKKDQENESEKLEAETRLKKAKAKYAEMELDELKGKMHRSEDVEAIITDHVLKLRAILLAMPGRLSVDLASIDNAAEAAERIRREILMTLEDLSDYRYDPEQFRQMVNEREGWKKDSEEDC